MSNRRIRRLLAASILASAPSLAAFAQTSGTWAADVGTTGGSWSVPGNWAGGAIADNGGTATFPTLATFTTAPVAVFQDLPTVTVGGMRFPTQITYQLRTPVASPSNSITLSGDAVLDAPIASINTLSTTTFGHLIQLPLAGSAGLTKRGPGTVTLWQNNNTYTGTTRVEGGVLGLRQIGDPALGNAANGIVIDGGTIRASTGAWTSARTVTLDAGGGTLEATTTGTITLSGPIGGAGGLIKTGSRGLNLSADNTYAGPTHLLAGSIGLSGNGALASTSSLTVRDALVIDNTATNLNNRINNAAPVVLQGAALTFTGNSAASSETFGQTTFSRGSTTVTVTPGANGPGRVEFITANRELGGTAFFRGTNLGAALSPGVAGVSIANAPTLVGGGGAAGSTNISIIPWAIGNTNATAALNASTNSFVTYEGTRVRPLDLGSEYATSILGAGSTDNVRFTGAQALGAPQTINSLILAGPGPLLGAGTLTVTSGALLNTAANFQVGVPLNFGPAEGIIFAPSSITFDGPISGTGGLTKQGAGAATFAAANTYTGTTVIGAGTAAYTASVLSGAPSPFGSDTSAVVLAPAGVGTGGTTARLVYTGSGPATFDRNLNVTGRIATNNAATPPGFGLTTANTLTVNGNVALDDTPLILVGTAGSTLVLDGDISGTGGPITDQSTGSGTIRLNGNNTFTGGAELSAATWQVGSDSAFGNGGLLKMVQLSTVPTIQAVGGPRIISNPTVSFSFNANYWTIGGNEDLTFTGSINLSGSYTHNITNAGLTTYAGVLHTGGFTKGGPGVLVLSGDNTYTGVTDIGNGRLRVAHSNALGSSAAPTLLNVGAILEITGDSLSNEPVTCFGPSTQIHSISGNNSLGAITLSGMGSISVFNGRLSTGNIERVGGGTQGLSKAGDGELSARRYRVQFLTINGGTAGITLGRDTDKTSVAMSLSIDPAARLDLGNNDFILDHNGLPSAGDLIRSLLTTGYNGGSWNGAGIASAAAAVAPDTALGYAESADVFTSFPATFSGQQVDDTSILVRYTVYGDANLDGTANIADFSLLAANFNVGNSTWVRGDFNYDGLTNIADFSLLAANFNQSLPAAARPGAVPEPAGAAAAALLAAGIVGGRRRRAGR